MLVDAGIFIGILFLGIAFSVYLSVGKMARTMHNSGIIFEHVVKLKRA